MENDQKLIPTVIQVAGRMQYRTPEAKAKNKGGRDYPKGRIFIMGKRINYWNKARNDDQCCFALQDGDPKHLKCPKNFIFFLLSFSFSLAKEEETLDMERK